MPERKLQADRERLLRALSLLVPRKETGLCLASRPDFRKTFLTEVCVLSLAPSEIEIIKKHPQSGGPRHSPPPPPGKLEETHSGKGVGA